jgi:lysophospholipase L1-like esterase
MVARVRPSWREAAGRLLLVGAGCGAGLLACEATVRLLGLVPSQGTFQRGEGGEPLPFEALVPDPEVGWRWRPSTPQIRFSPEFRTEVAINSEGFRSSREFLTASPEAGVIAVLGDSITEASQVPEESTFVHRLELALQQRPLADGPIAQVQNYGISGFGFPHQLQTYRHRARRHGPRLVVLCTFLFNDVWDSGLTDLPPLRPRFRLGPGGEIAGLEPFQAPVASSPSLLRRWLGRSAVGRLLLGLRGSGRQGLHPAAPTYEATWRPAWEQAWRQASWCLTQLAAEVRQDGARLLIVSIPPRVTADPAAWASFERDFRATFGPARLDRRAPDRRLAALCAQLDVPLLDLVPQLEAAYAAGAAPHFARDGHLTERGHQIVAQALEKALRERQPR